MKSGFHCDRCDDCDEEDQAKRKESRGDSNKLGFAETRRSVTKLNHLIIDQLVREGVPAVSVSPFPSWKTDQGTLVADAADEVERLLLLGFVPVLHGDAVLDTSLGCTILSGDRVMERLASILQPTCVGFITDVSGVYDRPPKAGAGAPGEAAQAQLLPELWVNASGEVYPAGTRASGEVQQGVGAFSLEGARQRDRAAPAIEQTIVMDVNERQDVTGGMRTKLACAASIAVMVQAPVYVAQVATQDSLLVLQGRRPPVCTAVLPRPT